MPEAESAQLSAFSIFEDEIADILRFGGNTDELRMQVVAEFSKGKPTSELATELGKIYHGFNGFRFENRDASVAFDSDGIHFDDSTISWDEAAERVEKLLEDGKFATNVELTEAKGYACTQLAQTLWYLYHDLADDARERYFSSVMFNGGFPDATARIAQMLVEPPMREAIVSELTRFAEDYSQNRDLLRFHYHKPRKLLAEIREIADMTREFTSELSEFPKPEMFITEEEISSALTRGGSFEGSKGRIYEYFSADHSSTERAKFARKEFGEGGYSQALSGASGSWLASGAKGIELKKSDCATVHLSWNQVAERLDELIRSDRYFSPEEKAKFEQYRAQNAARNDTFDTYRELKSAHPDEIVVFQVGDFFEIFGSDALKVEDSLDLDISMRELPGELRRVEMCGFPASQLEEYVEKIRENFAVMISATNGGERHEYSLKRLESEQISDDFADINPTEIREALAERGIVDGEVVEPEKLENDSFIRQVMEDVETAADEPTRFTTTPVAIYPTEKNKLPFDVVVETIRAEPHEKEPSPPAQNYRITDENLGAGGAKAKFRMNLDAIYTLKALENQHRQATPEEQEILAKYVGWGGLAEAFDSENTAWAREFKELEAALTPDEYAAARASTLNAHYTSPTVIRAIYEAVENMGFKSGNILEPAMGVGNFFGLLPESMAASKLYGVELDSITGRIAQQLYPTADITVAGFETTDRRDFYDLAVGNVPFGNYKVNDRAYNKLGFSIHNYFIAKSLDQVRLGGVVAFVTSRYTMDSASPEVRKHLAERAELLGAIRLPNNAFKANAGTEVVSDIIFLQKRDRPQVLEPDWVHLGKYGEFSLNSYFVEHPEMVLGRLTETSTQYASQDLTVEPIEGVRLADQLREAIRHIGGEYKSVEISEISESAQTIPADPNVKNYSFAVLDGTVYYRENSVMVKPELNATALERVKGMVELRDCVHELIDQQLDGSSDEQIAASQARLNELYDKFTAKFGLINDRANRLAFADDSSYYLLCSLEILGEDQHLKRKADMFTKRTIKPHEVATAVETAAEALALSISEKACVDLAYMSELTGKTADELTRDLRGVIFRLPESSEVYVTADEYLSGNVREKLRVAEAAEGDFSVNIEALRVAQPKDLDASEIEVRLGATWIDRDYVQEFMLDLLKPPIYRQREIQVEYSELTNEWNIRGKSVDTGIAARVTYGTDRASAYRILEDSLNLRDVRIYDTKVDINGIEKRVLNSKETTLAQQKQQAIKDAFREWLWKSPDRRHALVAKYNELFNSTRPREYDGSHITFSGMNPEISLREHQKNAIAHVLYGGNTLLAHEVGAGKTFEMVAAAMESKRLGLCSKPLFAVPNHLTEQWASEFLRLYPSANILVATKKDFEPANRKKFCARIATGEYDAVIIGHSQFEKIPMSLERQTRQIEEQIDEIEAGIRELKSSRGERFTIKDLERMKKSLTAKLEKLQANERKDDVVTFEQLGVDRLYVDEAHNFKNLFLYTKMRNVAGLSTTDAQKSSDMFMKCRYIDEITGNRGIVFATGTPVSNSMTELYTMMRYLQFDTLKLKGLSHFDSWASTFGETTTAIELAPEGTGYRARTRFAKFFNLPELMNMFKEVADIKTSDQLNLPTPRAIYETVVAQPSEFQKAMVAELSERASQIHNGSVDPTVDNMLKVTSDGRKLGLDQRIVNPNLPDDPLSKVNLCIDNIARIYDEGSGERLTQLVFCDISTPKGDGEFTVYDDIRAKLMNRGVPKEEIAFIHEADTEVKKKELFAKVRSGNVRILIGSTSKMGAGTNVQDRLIALHDLDCPWRPGDLERAPVKAS